MEFTFDRRPALRSVLAAGVVAASFIIQPAHANHCSPQFEQLRAQSAAARSTATAAIDRNDYRTACAETRKIVALWRQMNSLTSRPDCTHGRGSKPMNMATVLKKEQSVCSNAAQPATPARQTSTMSKRQAIDDCLVASPVSEQHCINNNSLTVSVLNSCDTPKVIEICIFTRKHGRNCLSSVVPVRPGFSWSSYACEPTGRYTYGARR